MFMNNPLCHPCLPTLMRTFGNAVRDPQKSEPEDAEAGTAGATPARELEPGRRVSVFWQRVLRRVWGIGPAT